VKSVNTNINPSCPSFEAVLSGLTVSGRYDHLRLILSKNNNRQIGQKYLMVCRSGFQVIKLIDIDYGENQICLALQDISTGMTKSVHLDIDDPEFRFILVSWQDIREMLKGENINKPIEDDLLEFEF
jgi:hypothetical protein